jgi:hypothetical protein
MGCDHLMRSLIPSKRNTAPRRESRRADTEKSFSIYSGRGLVTEQRRGCRYQRWWPALEGETPLSTGPKRVEKSYEVGNPKRAMGISREIPCAAHMHVPWGADGSVSLRQNR